MEQKSIMKLLKKSGVDLILVTDSELSKLEAKTTGGKCNIISDDDLDTLEVLLSASVQQLQLGRVSHKHSELHGRVLAFIANVFKSDAHVGSKLTVALSMQAQLLRLLALSYTKSESRDQRMVQDICLQTFMTCSSVTVGNMGCTDVNTENMIGIDVALAIAYQILNAASPIDSVWLCDMFRCSQQMLISDDTDVVGKLLSLVIPGLLNKAGDVDLDAKLNALWTTADTLYEAYGQQTYQSGSCSRLSGRPLMLLCGLADWFFPLDGTKLLVSPIKRNPQFWLILQSGFYNSNPLTRKRASYVLKRLLDVIETSATEIQCCETSVDDTGVPLFWWSADYSKKLGSIWQDFILIMETLEEKQVHVIKPLLPRIALLVAATHLTKPGGEGRTMLHTSWVCTIIQRMACHESSFIRREGICQLLQIDMSKFPLLRQDNHRFTSNALIAMLAESVVYNKPSELTLGSCAPAGNLLVAFLQNCVDSLHGPQRKGDFLHRFIGGLVAQQWSGSALVYVSRSLSLLHHLPVCGSTIITDIRSLLLSVLTNLEIHVRGAVQCYLATSVTQLLDTNHTSPWDLVALLSVLRGDECLCRGTALWNVYVSWLKTSATTSPAWSREALSSLMHDQLAKYLDKKSDTGGGTSSTLCGPVEVGALVRLLVLAWDADLLLPTRPQEVLASMTSILLSINTHAYMPADKADRALTVLTTLLQEVNSVLSEPSDFSVGVVSVARECMHEVLLFIILRATSDIKQLNDVAIIGLYIDAIRALATAGLDVTASSTLTEGIVLLATALNYGDNGQCLSTEIQMQRFAAVAVLGCLAGVAQDVQDPSLRARLFREQLIVRFRALQPVHSFSRPTVDHANESIAPCGGHGSSTWGRVSASFIQAQWECLRLVLHHDSEHMTDSITMADSCQHTLDVTSGTTIIPILQCIQTFITKVDPSVAETLVHAIWRKVKEERRNTLSFWVCLQAFVDVVLQPKLLLTDSEQLTHTLREVMGEFFHIGQEKEGLVNVLVNRLCLVEKVSCEAALAPDETALAIMEKYADVILEAVMYGPIHDKSRKYYHEVLAFLITQGNDLSINQLRDGRERNDHVSRAVALSALSRLSTNNLRHVTFAQGFIQLLYAQHKTLNEGKTYRRFTNSLPHRQKHRIMVALMVLEPFIYKDLLEDTKIHLLEVLVQENQPSVRFMAEWLLVRIILQEPVDGPVFNIVVGEITKSDERRMSYLCSIFTVATHAAKHAGPQKQEEMVLRVLPAILPWCTMHHFNCRTFAQACVLELWDTCHMRSLDRALSVHTIVGGLVDFQLNNINQSKGTRKLLDNVFFHFDPIADYSIETLTWTLPRLATLTEDEWIPLEVWEACDPSWGMHPPGHTLPLLNTRRTLDTCSPGNWKVKFTESEDFYVTDGNVQKKLIPWSAMLPENSLEPEELENASARQQHAGQLIVVTSLIDKVPNLGGLCRTSEIFGVAEFVISNMKYVRLHEFETLSVTAQKWVPIKEVRTFMLKTYMLQMKGHGYTLVGAEQTADSISLRDYAFPDKTLLLLGNEKEGIPVELIQLLDVCVEIPQQGVIRSLNVHVSGALLIWEYTRQQLTKASTSAAT